MNTPDQLPNDFEHAPLDERLREALDFLNAPPGEVAPPPPRLWVGVEAGLRPPTFAPRPARWRPVGVPVLTGMLGVALGVLLLRGGPPGVFPEKAGEQDSRAVQNAAPVSRNAAPISKNAAPVSRNAAPVNRNAAPVSFSQRISAGLAPRSAFRRESQLGWRPDQLFAENLSWAGAPISFSGGIVGDTGARPVVAAGLQPLVAAEAILAGLPATDSSAETRAVRRRALLAERAVLAALTHRTDSLLLTLGVEPEAPAGASTPLSLTVGAVDVEDSVAAAPFRRWSAAVSFAPERNFFGLQSPTTDTLSALRRTHEQGRAGYNAALGAEYRLTPRWSVGAGLGLTSYGAELRLTNRDTRVSVAYDTQTTHATQTTHVDVLTYSIRFVPEPVLSPIFNINQQIIGYDTVFVPRPDTVWTRVITDGTVNTNTLTTTPTVTTRQETTVRILQPNYRFLTVPLLVRYRLGTEGGTFKQAPGGPAANRWWADMALGAQLQFFLGGTQLASPDGRTWRTERVRAGGGPFRPLTVALTGAVALNYALTPRLSASVAPTLRYQTESVYKASTGLTQRPAASGVLMGVRLTF